MVGLMDVVIGFRYTLSFFGLDAYFRKSKKPNNLFPTLLKPSQKVYFDMRQNEV